MQQAIDFNDLDTEGVCELFYDAYVFGKNNDEDTVKKLLHHKNFDAGYDEGLFFIRAADHGNGDVPLLEHLINCLEKEGRSEELKNGLFEAALISARDGNRECLIFLVSRGADVKKIMCYTAYDNHLHIKNYIDELILKKSSVI